MHAFVLLAVLVYGGSAHRDLAHVESLLADALRGEGVAVLTEATAAARAAHAAGWVPEARLAFFAEAARRFDEGVRALERVEWARAVEELGAAEARLAGELAWPGAAGRMAEAALLRGVALFESRRVDEARRAWRRAAALDPAAQLTEARVRPDVVKAFRESLAGRRKVKVRVETDVPATVRVGGVGAAEAEVPDGEVLVTATAPGRRPVARLVETGAAPVRIALEVDEVEAAIGRAPAPEAVAAFADALGVDGAVVVAVGRDLGVPVVVARRVSARGCATAPETVHVRGDLAQSMRALATRLKTAPERCGAEAHAEAAVVLEAEPIVRPRDASAVHARRARRWYEQPWLYAGVIAGVAATVGLAVGLAPHQTQVSATVNGDAFSR